MRYPLCFGLALVVASGCLGERRAEYRLRDARARKAERDATLERPPSDVAQPPAAAEADKRDADENRPSRGSDDEAALAGEDQPSRGPDDAATLAGEGRPSRGPDDAAVTVVEFSPAIGKAAKTNVPTLASLASKHPDVRFVFRHKPGPSVFDVTAARAMEAAHRQGKFWDMRTRLLTQTRDDRLSAADSSSAVDAVGLDMDRYKADVLADEVRAIVDADAALVQDVEAEAVIFVQDKAFEGTPSLAELDRAIARAKAAAR